MSYHDPDLAPQPDEISRATLAVQESSNRYDLGPRVYLKNRFLPAFYHSTSKSLWWVLPHFNLNFGQLPRPYANFFAIYTLRQPIQCNSGRTSAVVCEASCDSAQLCLTEKTGAASLVIEQDKS